MMRNCNIKHQCPACLSVGIKNLTELALMFLSGLVVILFLGLALWTESVASGVFVPWLQTGFYSTVLLSNLFQVQSTEYNLTWEYDPHILRLIPHPERHQGKCFKFDKKSCHLNILSNTNPNSLVFLSEKVRQNKTKQADSCDKDSVQGSNLLQLLTIFNLI